MYFYWLVAPVKTVAHTWSILMGGAWWLVTLVAPLGGCCATQTLSAKPLILSHLYFASKLLYFWLHPVSSRCIQKSVYDSLVVSLLNIVDISRVASGMNWVAAKAVIFRSVKTCFLTHRVDSDIVTVGGQTTRHFWDSQTLTNPSLLLDAVSSLLS